MAYKKDSSRFEVPVQTALPIKIFLEGCNRRCEHHHDRALSSFSVRLPQFLPAREKRRKGNIDDDDDRARKEQCNREV